MKNLVSITNKVLLKMVSIVHFYCSKGLSMVAHGQVVQYKTDCWVWYLIIQTIVDLQNFGVFLYDIYICVCIFEMVPGVKIPRENFQFRSINFSFFRCPIFYNVFFSVRDFDEKTRQKVTLKTPKKLAIFASNRSTYSKFHNKNRANVPFSKGSGSQISSKKKTYQQFSLKLKNRDIESFSFQINQK